MLHLKKDHPKEKVSLHPRNKYRERYNFKELIRSCTALATFVQLNKYDDESIDFPDAEAVMTLNKALLKYFYGIDRWNIPPGYLCSPIPGRADYIHHIADLLGSYNKGIIPTGNKIRCLDIGVGANCIYPIIGNKEYGWSFVGSDIEPVTLTSAAKIIEANISLKGKVELRLQKNPKDIFHGIIRANDHFDLTVCNPPFHTSLEEAQAGTLRKLSTLNRKRIIKPALNFGGKNNELWCEGGKKKFVQKIIAESKQLSSSCFWFSTLVAKSSHLKNIYTGLKNAEAVEVKTISMTQGNKTSRIVAWTYLTQERQKKWIDTRWK